MRFRHSIGAKLAIAYALFLAPIAYLGFQSAHDQESNIVFAAKEIAGLRYIAQVRAAQDDIARNGDMSADAARIKANQDARGADLKTADATDSLVKSQAAAATQAAADLIGKAADGSNLTLDPDLDSFYTQDVVTVKAPGAVAGLAALVDAIAATAGHDLAVDSQVAIGVA
jgi:methyl-accepting chemotaxis protein